MLPAGGGPNLVGGTSLRRKPVGSDSREIEMVPPKGVLEESRSESGGGFSLANDRICLNRSAFIEAAIRTIG